MICKHNFFRTGEVSKNANRADGLTVPKFIIGVEVVCVACGQVRHAFSDGEVVVKVDGGKPIDEDHVGTGRE